MGKKKKIREEFDKLFQKGDEKAIKKMLDKNPWLLDEVSSSLDAGMEEQNQVIAAHSILINVEKLNLVTRDTNGWSLTNEGGKICDDYLNRNLGKFEI